MINWVVFDLGDVVLRSTTALPELADLLGVAPDRFTEAYFAHRKEYDLHTDPGVFWTSVALDAGAHAPDTALWAELVRIDDLGWSTTDPETIQLVDDLAALPGVELAVLSNAPSSMGRLIQTQPWSAAFEHLLFSGDLGVIKPDQQIYRTLLDRLRARGDRPTRPDEVAFLDDRADNIAGSIEAGIHGFVFTGAARARTDLRTLGLLV
jgi:putative hydrolase of the HAD superfamily